MRHRARETGGRAREADGRNAELDRPFLERSRPLPELDCPFLERDRPFPGLDRPHRERDRPLPESDHPHRGRDRPSPGRNDPIPGFDRPLPGRGDPFSGADPSTSRARLPVSTCRACAGAATLLPSRIPNPEVAMRQSEYEVRKRALEAEFNADVELLRAAYLAKLRALERLWLAAAEDLPAELPPPAVRESRLSDTVAANETVRTETPRPAPPAPPPVLRRGQVMDDLADIFFALPEEFEKRDVIRLLGYEPPRATMYRVLSGLISEKMVQITRYSEGHRATRYRKLPQPLDDDPG
jgi:hypothetical protein